MDAVGTDSPPLRNTILGSFLGRGRPRNSSQSHIDIAAAREMSPSPPTAQPPSPIPVSGSHRRRPPPAAPGPVGGAGPLAPSTSHQHQPGLTLSHMLRRRRSAGNVAAPAAAPAPPQPLPTPVSALPPGAAPPASAPARPTTGGSGGTHRLRLVPHLDSRRSLRFDPIARDLRESEPALRIGRFTDRSGLGLAAVNALSTNKIAFRSKVVSRAHAEVWVEASPHGGPPQFFIRDTKSSSGTFLNHVRLSPANTESRAHQIKDGDILQLGVDYQGGAEDIYKSVKIRIEVGREWQAAANAFNTNALKNLKTLAIAAPPIPGAPAGAAAGGKRKAPAAGSIPDCCICLFPVSIRQALFIAPCSHAFHYKCLRPLLEAHHPAFSCPLCRTFADLEEDVEVEGEEVCDFFLLLFFLSKGFLSFCFFSFFLSSFLAGEGAVLFSASFVLFFGVFRPVLVDVDLRSVEASFSFFSLFFFCFLAGCGGGGRWKVGEAHGHGRGDVALDADGDGDGRGRRLAVERVWRLTSGGGAGSLCA
ncbi:hypothetical protein FB451DRAFT_1044573 [Mycena latifolia]|nr:hypothetical protein FB451DRAFT_1044573 [Mycena latifolia]